MNTLLERRKILASGRPAPPPAPSVIPYIRGGGGSYINTGITPDETTRVIIWARNLNPHPSQYGWVLGSRIDNQDSSFGFVPLTGASSGKIRVCYGNTNTDNINMWTLLSHYHKYELCPSGFFVDDVLVSSVSGNPSNSYPLFIFGMNNAGSVISQTSNPIDVFACKIYKGGVLVRDFVATNSPSVGLYDNISETLFTNDGSGSFTYGTFNPSAYVPVEHIEFNGKQYFDSGAYGGYSVPIVGKFRYYGGTNSLDSAVFGYRSNDDWCEMTMGPSSNKTNAYFRLGADSKWYQLYSAASSGFSNKDIVFVKSTTPQFSLYLDYALFGSSVTPSVQSSFVTSGTILIGAEKWTTASPVQQKKNNGRIYYISIGNKNFVPAKVNGVAGMYETYNDVFYPSESSYAFMAGPEI